MYHHCWDLELIGAHSVHVNQGTPAWERGKLGEFLPEIVEWVQQTGEAMEVAQREDTDTEHQ